MYIRRAVLPASPQEDTTPSSSLVLLPLLSLSVVGLILLFLIVRFVRRGLHLPNLSWLRGKGQGARGRIGSSSVELLPTSFKSVPASSPSPFSAAFNLEGNAGKNSVLLSRSSSLDALPSASSPPHLTSRKHPDWRVPFSLPAFFKSKDNSPHRRSRSLSTTHRTTSLSMPTSVPSSPKNFLIDISPSGSSPMSASSDLGTHKLHPDSPLIPGLPIPTPSPGKVQTLSGTQAWAFDVEEESHDITDSQARGPLPAALKSSQSELHAKPTADSMPLIQYNQPSSPTPPLVPKRLSNVNPFAGLVDSFSSQPFISNRSTASSSSPPLTPSFPPGIELVSLKPTTGQSTPNLLDLDVPPDYENKTTSATKSTRRVTFVDPLVTAEIGVAPTHDIHMETVIDPAESVSDPFDDSHAITLATGLDDAWNSDAVPSVEISHQPPAELPLQSSEHVPAVPIPVSPSLLPSKEPVKVEKLPLAEPEPLTVSRSLSAAALPGGAKDEDSNLEQQEAGNDLMSFDHAGPAPIDQAGKHCSGPVVELGIDMREMDPADTWFTEEPTAVWDVNWTSDKDILLDLKPEEVEDRERYASQEERINVLDELLAGTSEPIELHVFEEREMTGDTVSEQPQGSNSSAQASYSNDNNDVHEPIVPYSNIQTAIVLAETSLPSLHTTPSTPLSELVSLISVASSPIVEEYADPDIMPLPDLPPLSVAPTPISPVPVKAQPPSVHQAQMPTPPASPPPPFNSTARPSSSLRVTDSPAFGLPAAGTNPPVSEVGAITKHFVEVENKANEADCALVIDSVVKEDSVVKAIEPPTNELPLELKEDVTMTEPQLGSASIPGCFPTSPQAPEAPSANIASSPPASLTTNTLQAQAANPASNRIRALKSVIDIVLTMQLRPGLGAGADPAWMVRFLMTVFGWFAILVSGDLQS